MQEGISVIDTSGEAVIRNPAGRRMLGLSRSQEQDVLGADRLHLWHLDGVPITDDERPSARALRGEEIHRVDYLQRLPGALEERILEVNATPLPAVRPGQAPRAVIAFRDVTAERRHREQLEAFAGVVAHDLGNPLAAVHGWVEVLQGSLGSEPVDLEASRRSARHIDRARSQMQALIDDLLTYAVSRDAALETAEVDLSEVTCEMADIHRDGPAGAHIDVQPGLLVRGDTRLVRQLMANLLSNAVKYVAPGTRPVVSVTGVVRGDRLHVAVTDNGIGVPAEQRELIFEPFHRAHASYVGTGIGLGICTTVVQRHAGAIAVADGPDGRGSAFVFDLPAAGT